MRRLWRVFRLFPFFQLLTLNRHLVERRMSKFRVVPDPSPIALARRAGMPGFRVTPDAGVEGA